MFPKKISPFAISIFVITLTAVACATQSKPVAPAAPAVTTEAPKLTEAPMATEPPTAEAKPTEVPAAPTHAFTDAVAILVVDAFNPPKDIGEMQERFAGSSNTNCIATPDGQAYKAGGAADGAPIEDHGKLIYTEADGLITGSFKAKLLSNKPGSSLFSDPSLTWMDQISIYSLDDKTLIFLVKVDTNKYTTEHIRDRIQITLQKFRENQEYAPALNLEKPVNKFVLNMSFAIVPCDALILNPDAKGEIGGMTPEALLAAYEAIIASDPDAQTKLTELKQSIDKLLNEPDINQRYAFVDEPGFVHLRNARMAAKYGVPFKFDSEKKTWTFNDNDYTPWIKGATFGRLDPLFDLLSKEIINNVIPIAAAGNSGFPFPFAPALWESVLSVSSMPTDENTPPVTRASYSNAGEVAMDGRFGTYQGTSFAAPQLAVRAAIYLLKGNAVKCDGAINPGLEFAPPMKYGRPNSTSWWSDKPLDLAAKEYCDEFLR